MQCQSNQDNGSPLWFQTLLRQRGIRPTSPGGPSSRFLIFSPRWSIQGEPLGRLSGRKAVVKEPPSSHKRKAAATADVEWDLHLYIAGSSRKSAAAFGNLKRLCD